MDPSENHPLITIIVAVLNNGDTLTRCLDSILCQTHSLKELILIDGGSTDKTLSILDAYRQTFAYWESKPDRGIYHAWNKALNHARGDWICFLGADDFFWHETVLENLLPSLGLAHQRGIRVVYGRVAKLSPAGKVIRLHGKPWDSIRWQMRHGMPVDLPHPGLMHHRDLFNDRGHFDEAFRIAGDYDLLLRELKCGEALFIDQVITVGMQIGGLADTHGLLARREVALARRKNKLHLFSHIWLAVTMRALLKSIFKKSNLTKHLKGVPKSGHQ